MPKKNKVSVLLEPASLCYAPFRELQIEGRPERANENWRAFKEPLAKISSRLILKKEKALRGGKTMLIVEGFSSKIPEENIGILARQAKAVCGCGGTVNDRKILLQGDQPEKVRKFFELRGFHMDGVR